MDVKIESSWKELLKGEFDKPYFQTLTDFVRQEYATQQIFPPAHLIFNAFDQCPVPQTKVVIIGQDPYHGYGQAHGLCFSVNDGIALPPSLINIYTEIEQDTGNKMPQSGNLERWARQGVLLLNATLTVRAGLANSHQGRGWEMLTDAAIANLSQVRENLVFMLWGNYAQQKEKIIDTRKHLILKTVHPSPLSAYRGFFGCKHFSQANNYLKNNGIEEIKW
ncbi:uracil-DNA glycosylase 2 [Bacteroidia bacterium]|nr:uracil-DNA glycosylase 2 [Bacteroidia bacterium]GHV43479.1 uracil-DNA glycosylase 2 [Bacteroidia bacterium]